MLFAQEHGIVKRGRSNRRFTKIEPGATIQNADPGYFFVESVFLNE